MLSKMLNNANHIYIIFFIIKGGRFIVKNRFTMSSRYYAYSTMGTRAYGSEKNEDILDDTEAIRIL